MTALDEMCRQCGQNREALSIQNTEDAREPLSPNIVTKQEVIKAEPEAPVIIPCVAHAHPPPKYRWFLNRKGNIKEPLISSASKANFGFRASHTKSEVLVLAADHEALRHSSRHSRVICEAYNSEGTSTMEIVVEREFPVSMEISPRVLILDTSSSGQMHCRVSGGHSISSYTWYKDGQLLAQNGAAVIKDGGVTLEIQRAEQQDVGMYQCFVRIQEKLHQAAAELRLGASPPTFLYRFIQQTLTPGPAVSLKCIAGGTPTPTISWSLDGFPLPQSERIMMGQYVSVTGEVISHVNISRTHVEDGGQFSCTARNSVGSVSHSAPLYIYGPPHVRNIGSLTAVAGESFKVRCPVSGYPIPSVTWTKGGRELPLSRRHDVSGPKLTIYKVNRGSDEGQYVCTASDRQGRVAAKTMQLRVVEPPKVAPFMLPTSLTSGSRVAVQCVLVQGDPPVELQWFHNHRLAHELSGVTVTPLGRFVLALVIDRVTPKHAGNYTCKVTSRRAETSDSHSAVLRVNVPPIIKSFDFGELISGMRTQVTCLVQTGDPPIKITWLQNGSPLIVSSDVIIRQMDAFSSSLIFSKVNSGHVGNYTCVATNDAKQVRNTAELLVRVAPHWKAEPRDVSVIKGEDTLLNCLAEGFPTPTITWRRVQRGNKQNIFHRTFNPGLNGGQTMDNGSLLLRSVTEETEGSYLCEVSNGVGTDLSSMAHVNVQVPPIVKGEKKIEIRKGDFVSLKCHAHGDSPLTLSIAKDGQPVDTADPRYSININENKENLNQLQTLNKIGGMNVKFVELKVNKVATKDSGEFSCTATNPYGSHTHVTKLIVQDVPEIPRNLRLVNEGSRFVTISWTPSSSPSTPILNYVIYTKKLKDSWDENTNQKIHVKGKSLSAEIKDLVPASSYQIRIAAVNSVGKSPPSEPLTIHTKGEAPSAPPQNVRALPVSSNKIRVEWSPPDPKSWHGQLIGYYVGYREERLGTTKDYIFEKMKPVNEGTHSWTVDRLKKYKRYEFVVQAFNALGPGPLSREVHATTHEDVPEAAPEDVTCVSLTSKSFEVSWSPPPPDLTHGKIISYSIVYSSQNSYSGSAPKETHVISGKSTILINLEPASNYSVTVAALTKAGAGKASEAITCTTEEDVPDAPAGIKCIPSGPNEVVVAWSDPLRKNGVLTKFTIYIKTSRSRETKRRMVPAQSHYYQISNLIKGEEVEVWITASTRVGESQPTKTASAIPSTKVPAGITALSTSVRVAKGSDILLPCPYLGIPEPTIIWKKDEVLIEKSSRWKKQPDGGFLLHDAKPENSGNYSCQAANVHGTDHIIYSLRVMVPPQAPRLRSLGSTAESLTVTWQLGDDGGSPLEKLTLTWRPDREEWKEIVLPRHTTTYTLQDLSCGTSYHLYLTPLNAIGPGAASEVVSVRTKGGRPTTPPQHKAITVNESSATLNLVPFNDSECPVSQFYVKVKPSTSSQWITASDRLPGIQKEFLLPNLNPEAEYDMEVTAFNSAGETVTRYSFRTLPNVGDLMDDPRSAIRDQEWISDTNLLWKDPAFIIPIILSCIAFVAIFISAVICVKRKSTSSSKPSHKDLDVNSCPSRGNYTPNDHNYYPTIKKVQNSPHRDVESIDTAPEFAEEIYPYATFQLQQQNDGSTLQTLVFQDPRKTSVHTVAYRNEGMERKPSQHGRSLSSGSDYGRIRRSDRRRGTSYSGVESEESISDTDTDFPSSIRTDNLDGRNAHNLLYLPSDASTIPSPQAERKRLPYQANNGRMSCVEENQDRIYGISAIRDASRLPPIFTQSPAQKASAVPVSRRRNGAKELQKYNETECDRGEPRRRSSKVLGYTYAV